MLHTEVTMPSTLGYRERLSLAIESPPMYNQLYASSQSSTADVWERLTADSGTRRVRTQSARAYREGDGAPTNGAHTLSGFVSNTTKPSAVYTTTTFKNTHAESSQPVEGMHPMVAWRFKKRDPIGFMATIRPDTQTMTQTLRMMGTYAPDHGYARAFGIHIPHSSPGGTGHFHPDIVLGEATAKLSATAKHPGWAKGTAGGALFGFSGRAASAR
ncbi:hypothetical protein FOA52_006380 [Chlamydomonas sp. UWO 241]|nr:hypothetical protein FOA52_006380 [Chlamydomonas sp. UWO 241]